MTATSLPARDDQGSQPPRTRIRHMVPLIGGRVDPAMPGPKRRSLLGELRPYRDDPFTYLRHGAAEFGDVFKVPLPGLRLVVVNHPDLVGALFNDREGRYSMIGPFEKLASRTVGRSLPLMEGEAFKARRRTLQPMFSRRSLASLADTISEQLAVHLDKWDKYVATGEVVDLQHEISKVTLPTFLRTMYSTGISDAEITQTDIDLRLLLSSFALMTYLAPPPNLLPFGPSSVTRAMMRLRAMVYRLIDDRLANPIEGTDLLQLLMDARYDDGSGLSRRDLAMELIILMAGGYETIVASISWTIALLAANPEHANALHEEVAALGGARPTLDDCDRLVWTKACFDEGQRLQGHPFHPRTAMCDHNLAGYRIPRGTMVGVSVYTLHRDERWWGPNPDAFDPTRFTDRDLVRARPNLAFIPFGAGPHHCIGSGLAYMNAQFLLALMSQRYRFETPRDWVPRHAATFSCTVQGGVPVTIRRPEGWVG